MENFIFCAVCLKLFEKNKTFKCSKKWWKTDWNGGKNVPILCKIKS